LPRLICSLGVLVLIGVAWLFSDNRRSIRWNTVAWGLGLQAVFALAVLHWSIGRTILAFLGDATARVLAFSYDGSGLVFGALGQQNAPVFIFAFQVLPAVIFVAALLEVLYHFGIMQQIVGALARLMRLTMQISGAESLAVAASIFVGQTGAPMTIRPYLHRATRSELMTLMTSGMAHVSGGMLAAYLVYGIQAKDVLAAVLMTAPGTIMLAKILVPETEIPETAGSFTPSAEPEHANENLLGAVVRGTQAGGRQAVAIAIMLISFLALVGLANGTLSATHTLLNRHGIPFPESLSVIFGTLFAPVAWLIGIPWHLATQVGGLMGTRLVLNELIAYSMLGAQKSSMDARSFAIATFALCGFANFGSVGIQIASIGALAPERRTDLARLGLRALMAGTMANMLSAAIAGIFLT
jgi:CNT family concentrative nucleoside transporter